MHRAKPICAIRLFPSPLSLLDSERLQSSFAVYSYAGATRRACHHGMQVMAVRMLLAWFKMLGLGAIFRFGADATTMTTVNCIHVVQPVP